MGGLKELPLRLLPWSCCACRSVHVDRIDPVLIKSLRKVRLPSSGSLQLAPDLLLQLVSVLALGEGLCDVTTCSGSNPW
jgi:hypothetical protein